MGKNLSEIALRSRPDSMRENVYCYEEILHCGSFAYRYIWNWPKMPEPLMGYEVCGTACDREGNVYITSRAPGYPVAVFDPDGNFLRYIGTGTEIGRAHGIYVDDEENVWITDDKYHVARKFGPDGTCLLTLGNFKQPSDTGINITAQSTRLRFYTIKRLGEPFNRPTRIIKGQDGFLYASDGYGNSAIHRFSPDGTLLNTWGGMGDEPGHFGVPHSIWMDKRSRLWVADREFDRVQVFTTEGKLLKCIDNLLFPYDVVSDETYVYVSEREGRITIFDLDFHMVAQLGHFGGSYNGHSIAVDGKGNLYLGQLAGNYNLVKLERIKYEGN